MAAGPIFAREALTAPRRFRHYLMRSGFISGLLVLFYSIRQATLGFQDLQLAGDVATFSNLTFQVFCFLQLTLGLFFATLFSAANVAQEKDRQTLILLLMTDMRNHELALGKLLASLLIVGVLLTVSLPVFCALRLLGGITWAQIVWSQAIIASAALAAGTWGGMVAFWREKTFQTLAISVMGVVLFVALAEAITAVIGIDNVVGYSISRLSPFRALSEVLDPLAFVTTGEVQVSSFGSVLSLLLLAVALAGITINRMRVWNPSRQMRMSAMETEVSVESVPSKSASPEKKHRTVWHNPVIWREMCTRAYGRRMIWIKLAYVLLVAAIGWFASRQAGTASNELVLGMLTSPAFAFLGIGIMSLLLLNAQAVTSITNERDGRTLEPLLITDLSAREFMLGKIGGALWNAREMIVLPVLLLIWMTVSGSVRTLTVENCSYLILSYLVLAVFAVTLGLHSGLTYENSRSAIGNSLGTMFFLFVGIFIFMLLLVEARSSFAIQMQSFIVFIGFGSLALYSSLTHKNPSSALTLASIALPFLTFYAITGFLLDGNLGVCFWICVAYGFTVIAMLIPAMTDFDVALGRNTQDVG
ncbi:MAG: ABC transporter permease [Planctomyces sp.]|nr:ABC transporter permease [Planctomyces sp.]